MKKIFFILICAICALTVNAQRYMSVTKTDGSVLEIAISSIDSIHFFVKDNTTPEPPVTNPDNPFENGHEYVDLGLPSGTLWAKMNIGAEKITDYGDYFAWGETTPKKKANGSYDNYKLENYKWYTSDTIVETDADGFETITYKKGYTKYCYDSSYGYEGHTDNLTTLELSDDAAHVNWGGAWRMPTIEEFNELINNCTWTWATLNGVNGYKVTSKAEGNTNYIFLPAAGYRGDWSFGSVGSSGYYWSSSLGSDGPGSTWNLYFYSGYRTTNYCSNRCCGLSVRPVCSSR